ncbi:MAG: tryptophan synthase subunit alpha [Chloroflexota bacterium]
MSTGVARLRAAFRPGRATVVAYVPILDPASFDARTLDAFRDAGVGVLEVGIPSRDPWMDGAEVRDSMARALDAGATAERVAEALGAWRATQAGGPAIIWFSYPELPLDALGRAAAMGAIDGVLMLEPWRTVGTDALTAATREAEIGLCAFLPWAPTDRDRELARAATGYVMVQARPGVTGVDGAPADPTDGVRLARSLAPGVPVVAGFGVSGPDDVRRLAATGVDGVVVGSAVIRAGRAGGADAIHGLLAGLIAATGAAA